MDGDSLGAKCRGKVSEKMNEIRAKRGKLQGEARSVGRVRLFPRKCSVPIPGIPAEQSK